MRAAMTDLVSLSEESAAIIGQSAETTRDFEHMTRELSAAVARFKVEGTEAITVDGDDSLYLDETGS